MGGYDGVKVFELIGIFMLYLIGKSAIQKILDNIEITD